MNQRHPPDHDPHAPTADVQSDARTDAPHVSPPHGDAQLSYRNQQIALSGRALRLILWLAAHDTSINGGAADCGQIWITWKGGSIAGEIRTRLS